MTLEVVRKYRKMLDCEIPLRSLIVTKHLSNPKKHRQHVSQIIAAEQLMGWRGGSRGQE